MEMIVHSNKKLTSFSVRFSIAMALTFCVFLHKLHGQERPNILFLVIEDTSPYLMPAYGNKDIETPNIDFLAANGNVFNNAFSNAPYCSPARSSLISGSYATSYGTDWHRNSMFVPQEYFFPQYLKEAGYFTVNAGKTDYNATKAVQDKNYPLTWDKMSGSYGNKPNATYNDKERGNKPFYAQFNNGTTHMSRMTSVTLDVRAPLKLDTSKIELPPHVPNLPEMKADYAVHLEGVQGVDKWVGVFLDDLRNKDLLDNTIIFFFSDHGGCLPRGKAFPYTTGMKAAMVIYAPDKWKHLLPAPQGTRTDQLIEFSDLGPTLLSIAGVEVPGHMQGVPFMGTQKSKRTHAFAFRTNSGNHFDPSRSVFDENYHYIKFYTPYKRQALKQMFQWGMPAQLAWDKYYYHNGNIEEKFKAYYEPKMSEMLFDMKNDPYGLVNLINDPRHQEKVVSFRQTLNNHLRETRDLGFFPKDVRNDFTKQGISLYEWVRDNNYDLEKLYTLVQKASVPDKKDVKHFETLLSHERPEIRLWAASGLANLASQKQIKKSKALVSLVKNEKYESIKAIAAEGLVYMSDPLGLETLLSETKKNNLFAASSLENTGPLSEKALDELAIIAKESENGGVRFAARGILINFGRLPNEQLFEQNQVDDFVESHHEKVKTWGPTLPDHKSKIGL